MQETERRRAAGTQVGCDHCGLPVPARAADPRFCCPGCATVWELLHANGLERFYELGGGRGFPVPSRAAGAAPRSRPWLDALVRPIAGARAGSDPGQGLAQVDLDVQGIHCAACVWVLQTTWGQTDGTLDIRINPTLGQMRLVYDPAVLDLGAWLDAVEALGYAAGPPNAGREGGDEVRGLLLRLGACAAFALNAMLFSLAGYLGMSAADGPAFELFEWLSFGLATAAVAVGGPVFFRAAAAGLRRRVLHLDLPISLGIALGYLASTVSWFAGAGEPYFDSVTVFVALMLAGRHLQRRALHRNRSYLLAEHGMDTLQTRRIVPAGDAATGRQVVEQVAVEDVLPGDRLLVAPGDLVPVRATVVGAAAAFSLDWILGESEPRRFEPGSEVPAGAFAAGRHGTLVEATATAAESGLQRLLARPLESDSEGEQVGRAPAAGFWPRLNRFYVLAVLVLAALAGGVWSVVDPSRAVAVVTSVLIVTCPCALGIATPLAFELALARLRKRGVFVRRSSLLERARAVRRVVFDKTGTLTWGGARVTQLRPCCDGRENCCSDVLYTMAATSNHPVSRAIAKDLAARGCVTFLADLEVEEVVGRGMLAHRDGHEYRLGSGAFTLGDRDRHEHSAGVCTFTRDGHVECCYAVDEDVRAGAAEEIEALTDDRIAVWIASGDRAEKVDRAARTLGVPAARARGDLRPADKAALLTELGAARDTLMVGDGLNDTLAFESALCSGAPALDRPEMPGRADFFYVGAGVGAVRAVLGVAVQLDRTVRTGLWLAAFYNAAALALCFTGLMSPMLAAVLMPASSLALIAWTFRGMTRALHP